MKTDLHELHMRLEGLNRLLVAEIEALWNEADEDEAVADALSAMADACEDLEAWLYGTERYVKHKRTDNPL